MNNSSPFKFLDAYDKNDHARFFGREKETAQLYNAVHLSNLTLLYGASGTGKTSLINCGLGNKFYETDWLPIFIRRGVNINTAIDEALYPYLYLQEADYPNFFDLAIQEKIQIVYNSTFKPIYLIFDQFEELFILGDSKEQQLFYKKIAILLKYSLQTKIIIVMREEWIAYLNEFERVVPTIFENRLRIEKMNNRNLARVIALTCRYENITILDIRQTIRQIIENLRDEKEGVELTHLQVYLDRLYRKALARGKRDTEEKLIFDKALVDEVGPMDNVLSAFLDEQFSQIEMDLKKRGLPNTKGIPLEILFTLVTNDRTKQNLSAAEILEALPQNYKLTKEDVIFCLNAFKNIKLLRQLA